jgi:serine/threonine-protein kinase
MALEKIGRYEVRGELGKGAMGIVYKAEDPTIGRIVAVKTTRLDIHTMDDDEVIRRFRHEARAAGALQHANIVTIYDAGEQGEIFYIAMEYVEGETLQRLLRQRRFAPQEVLSLARQICAGLDYAHSHGVIHRDVKPANIVVTADGSAKIMDFGIAKTSGGGMTTDGQVLGTPYYMSPEQVRGRPLDGRSDLFCFAVILYEMLTGQKPFAGENPNTIIYNIVNEEPALPHEVDPAISPELSGVLLRALQKNPNHRYPTGAELVRELSLCLGAGVDAAADSNSMAATAGRPAQPRDDLQKLLSAATASSQPAAPEAASPPAAAAADPRTTVQVEPRAPQPAPAKAPQGAWQRPALVAVLLVAAALGYFAYQSRSRDVAATEPSASSSAPPATEPPPGATPAPAPTSTVPAGTESASSPPVRPASRMATVSVESTPQGADIYLDGAKTGKTTPARLAVAPGKHTLTLSKEGYQDATTSPDLRAGEPFIYATALKEKKGVGGFFRRVLGGVPEGKGVIEVRTSPKGATILVNGKEHAQKSNTDLALDPGTYTVALRLAGHKTAQRSVRVEEGKKVKLEEKLVRE